MELAKSQLEWMSDQIGKAFETKRSNPFNFRCLKLARNLDELAHIGHQQPKVGAGAPRWRCWQLGLVGRLSVGLWGLSTYAEAIIAFSSVYRHVSNVCSCITGCEHAQLPST